MKENRVKPNELKQFQNDTKCRTVTPLLRSLKQIVEVLKSEPGNLSQLLKFVVFSGWKLTEDILDSCSVIELLTSEASSDFVNMS